MTLFMRQKPFTLFLTPSPARQDRPSSFGAAWILLLAFATSFTACQGPAARQRSLSTAADSLLAAAPLVLTLEKVADSLEGPVALENAHDGSGRLFVGEQSGLVRIIRDGQVLPEPFLDIRSQLVPMGKGLANVGLLGLAFHPDFRHNGRFFVHYTAPDTHEGFHNKSVLEEFHVSHSDADKADPHGRIILEVEQPAESRNGGNIVFGRDGYLYMGFGDGGRDKKGQQGSGQDLSQLLGKIIRIDVDHGHPYAIPPDNPFVGGQARPEIWAYGLRMPWRISFDPATGNLFCGDVGQGVYEEVDIIKKGGNYGWKAKEGSHPYDSALYAGGRGFIDPVAEYVHPRGVCIIGGYVYRGKHHPMMRGKYFFADWAYKLFFLSPEHGTWAMHDCQVRGVTTADGKLPFRVNSFGEDESGELYLVTQTEIGAFSHSGAIYRLGMP